MGKIVLRDGETVRVVEQTRYATEQELQDFLLNYPGLIPLDEAETGALPLMPIGREVPVASGFLDVLYIDASGLLTIAETKLKRNPEARREVVGQILEYAAALSTWSDQDVSAQAQAFLASEYAPKDYRSQTFEDAVRKLVSQTSPESKVELSLDDLRAMIGDGLRNGNMRLIVAVDEIHDSLRSTITFLNTHSNFQIYLLQVVRFSGEHQDIFVPSLFGYAKKVKPSSRARGQWNLETFLADLARLPRKELVDHVTALYQFADNESADNEAEVRWGTGAKEGTFTFHYIVNDQRVSVFTATSKGQMWLNFGTMKGRVSDANLAAFREDLNRIDGVNLAEQVVDGGKYPVIKVSALSKPESLELFKDAVRKLGQAAKRQEGLVGPKAEKE